MARRPTEGPGSDREGGGRRQPVVWREPGRAGAPPQGGRDLLIVTSMPPYPPTWGGAQRSYQLARNLARWHRVTVLTYALPDQRPDLIDFAEYVHDVVGVVRPHPSRIRRRAVQLASLGSSLPAAASELRSRGFQAVFDDLLASRPFDLVQLESSQLAWLDVPAGTPVVINEQNIESELLERMAQGERSAARRWFSAWDARRYRRFEEASWAAAGGCAMTSPREAEILARRSGVLHAVVGNGVDPDDFRPDPDEPKVPGRLVFTGLLRYRPNIDGVRWFLDEVLPLVHRERPDAVLEIVGGIDPVVAEALSRPGVVVRGRVPQMPPELRRAEVVVVPVRMGGGTRLKVVEAMATGCAVVSTTLGAEGIDVQDRVHVRIADEPQDFAAAVVELLSDQAARARMGVEARELASTRYSWAGATRALEQLHEQVLAAADRSIPTIVPATEKETS